MNVWVVMVMVVGIGIAAVVLSYRVGYMRGYAAKERVVWDEDGKRIREYRMSGGYQPVGRGLDSDAPQGGSGVPRGMEYRIVV